MLSHPHLDSIGKPYHIYTDYVEHEAMKQFISVMEREDTVKGALMPDVHAGFTLPIGGVVLSKDRIYPEYVGVDIGCGMVSVNLKGDEGIKILTGAPEIAANVIDTIIPTGFNVHTKPQERFILPTPPDSIKDLVEGATLQMGSLGGGNHFIEVGRGVQDDEIYITIHSGSRGLGHKVATHYMKLSNNAGFHKDDPLFQEYLDAMNFVVKWAYFNRMTMVELVKEAFGMTSDGTVACVHNFAKVEEEGVYHYKGANNLPKGICGIIPANMRDGVYVVKGRGSEDAMDSVSHGAGRVMSRSAAKKKFTLDEFKEAMEASVENLDAFKVDQARLDECPMAYKPIDEVMERQKDLCYIVQVIKPILNVKG